LLVSPIGSRDKAVKSCQVEKQTNQANAAGPDFDAASMAGNPEAVEERQARPALKELCHMSTDIEAVVP